MKGPTNKYMKPHERVLYNLALVFGALLALGGLIMIIVGVTGESRSLWIWGIVLLVSGICEIIGVGILLWTDGEKKNKAQAK